MPNFWTLTLCCFFVGHKWPDPMYHNCPRCGITESHLAKMSNRWLTFLCVGPKCFLRAAWYETRKYVGNILCKNIGHRIVGSLRYHGKLDIKEASLIALGENEERWLVDGVRIDVKKRRDQLMDDGYFQRIIFCERCQNRFDKHSGEDRK